MGCVKVIRAVYGPYLRHVYCTEDSKEEETRKTLLGSLSLTLFVMHTLLLIKVSLVWASYLHVVTNVVQVIVHTTFLINLLLTKSLSRTKAGTFICYITIQGAIYADLLTFSLMDYYTAGVVGMDAMLLCRCSERQALVLRNVVSLYIILLTIEQTIGMGLFFIPEDTAGYDFPERRPASVLPSLMLWRLLVFLIDFAATRYFARSMEAEQNRLHDAVVLAEEIALRLACFRLEEATMLIDDATGLPQELHRAYSDLVNNLRTYKPYLPQACLPDEIASGTDHESTAGSAPSTGVKSSTTTSEATTPRELQANQGRKPVALVAVTLRGFAPVASHSNISAVGRFFEVYISGVVSRVKEFKGIVESFEGDRILVSFNAAKPCGPHSRNAVHCSMHLQKLHLACDTLLATSLELVVAVAGGRIMCGPMGCEGMMRYTILGKAMGWVNLLARYLTETGKSLGVDTSVVKHTDADFHFRLIDLVLFCLSHKPTCIYEPTDVKAYRDGEEWMYQLANNPNKWDEYNSLAMARLRGEAVPDGGMSSSMPPLPETRSGIKVLRDLSITLEDEDLHHPVAGSAVLSPATSLINAE